MHGSAKEALEMKISIWKQFGLAGILAGALMVSGCQSGQSQKTKQGAVAGAATGAILGGIIGHQSGRGLEGAGVGAMGGALAGGVLGSAADERASQQSGGTITTQPETGSETIAICPNCGAKNNVAGIAAGQSAQCGNCGKVFTP
jgi:outer membrane lipoprotein SlyB